MTCSRRWSRRAGTTASRRRPQLQVQEQAQQAREKARRQRRRSRIVVATMAAALVVVSGFGVASYHQFRVSEDRLHEAERQRLRAEQGERDARAARTEALRQRDRAEANQKLAETNQKLADKGFEEARGTVDELLTEMSQEGLKDIPGLQDLRQRFAQKAVTHYVIYLARRPDDPAVVQGHARSLTALGAIIGQVGSVEKAVSTLTRAILVHEKLVAKDPKNPEYRFQLAQAQIELAYLHWFISQMKPAHPPLAKAVEELERLVSQKHNKLEYELALRATTI